MPCRCDGYGKHPEIVGPKVFIDFVDLKMGYRVGDLPSLITTAQAQLIYQALGLPLSEVPYPLI